MTCLVAPSLPPDKDFHIYSVHSMEDVNWVNALIERLENCGFKCVSKDRDFKDGRLEMDNIESYISRSWKFMFVLSGDYIELITGGNALTMEKNIITEKYSNDKAHVVCLVWKHCNTPPTLTVFQSIRVKYDPKWFNKLLKALGATETSPDPSKESSFRHCSMCHSDFPQDFRQFQCHSCKKVGCLGCCNYMAPVSTISKRMEQVCHKCFSEMEEKRLVNMANIPEQQEEEIEPVNDPNAAAFGYIIYLHIGYGGVYKLMKSTRSTPKYCDICKRTSHRGMTLAQCRICFEIGCRTCINYYAPLTHRQIAMGSACFGCFQKRHSANNISYVDFLFSASGVLNTEKPFVDQFLKM